ncbi:hypothetical protein LCGC14_3026440 [marine sediment metagenome]|uniref:Extensin-like C-terminal domain-containing protein n=1 Tax=marine sediment metagenome TaxID=412755 RepID=A0A0F8Z1A6_9ZZZZ
MTPNLRIINDYIKVKYDLATGVTSCRRISGSQTYSQHSWSNAGDIYTSDRFLQRTIAADLKASFGDAICNILTYEYNAAHWNHIHVDLWPKGWLIPPCAGGQLRIKDRDGTVTYGVPFPLTIKEDTDMAILTNDEQEELQAFLKALKDVNSNVGFVRSLIPWFRTWRPFEPTDFAEEGSAGLPPSEVVTIIRDQ